jgi:peptide-methionine (S)-S-oxide reductase
MSTQVHRSAALSPLTTLFAVAALAWLQSCAADSPPLLPAPALDDAKAAGPAQTVVLSGGCFWGVQGVYEHVRGVRKVISGYAGGQRSTADYETVSTGTTGHAESVQITYDPAVLSYGEILRIFFSVVHDPTQMNRQGPDSGTQYRSMISYSDDAQQKVARAYIAQLNTAGVYRRPIVTQVVRLTGFYPAEGYHQDYLLLHPSDPYIAFNDLPKVENLQRVFPDYYAPQPVTVSQTASR